MSTLSPTAALTRIPTALLLAHCVSCDRDGEPIPDEVLDALLSQLDVQIEKAERAVEEQFSIQFSKIVLDTSDTLPESPPRAVKPLSPGKWGQAGQ